MAAARPHPPSSTRIAEARASGHLPRAPLVGFACGWLALIAACFTLGPRMAKLMSALLRAPLELAASGQWALAHARSEALVRELFRLVALALLGGLVVILLGRMLAQGFALARLSGTRAARFAALEPSRIASVLWCLGCVFIVLGAWSQWATLELSTLSVLGSSSAQQLVLLTLSCMLIDIAFARAQFFASLWLTRREHLDEQREAFGRPEARAALHEARRASRASS